MKNIDEFIGKVVRTGGSLSIIIPANNVDYSGVVEGDFLKVYYKKVKPNKK